MEKEKYLNKRKGIVKKIFKVTIFIFTPFILILYAVLNWFENKGVEYCLVSKSKFQYSYETEFNHQPISDILIDNVTFIAVGNKDEREMIFTCAKESEDVPSFKIRDIRIGDTIFKKKNSNNFTILNGGVRYIFVVDIAYEKSIGNVWKE